MDLIERESELVSGFNTEYLNMLSLLQFLLPNIILFYYSSYI